MLAAVVAEREETGVSSSRREFQKPKHPSSVTSPCSVLSGAPPPFGISHTAPLPPLTSFIASRKSELALFLSLCHKSQRLDSTRGGATSPSAAAATTTTGEAGDDDVKEADDGVDDGSEDGGNAVDDGHQAVADGLEDAFDA